MLLTETPQETPAPERVHPLRQPWKDARALVLFNPKAGGTTEADRDKLIAAIKAAGIEKYALVGAEMMSNRLFKRASDFDVIIVLGGDGTAKAVAERAPADAPPLILLPGGTLNVLPRALYGELAWPEALAAALSHGEVKRLASGRANGKQFFVAAMFGAPTLLALAREAVREGKMLKAWRRFRHFMKRSFSHSLRSRPDGKRYVEAEAVGALCPSYSGAIDGDGLEWVKLDPKLIVDLARVSLRAIGDGWRKDPAIEITPCCKGDIRSSGIIPAVLDGEPTTFLSHVRIAYDPKGPRVIALPRES